MKRKLLETTLEVEAENEASVESLGADSNTSQRVLAEG